MSISTENILDMPVVLACVTRKEQVQAMLDSIQLKLKMFDPEIDNVDWGHFGSISAVHELLADALQIMP